MQVQSLSQEDPLEEDMTTHSSIPAWSIPWIEEPGGLQSIGSQRDRTEVTQHAMSRTEFSQCLVTHDTPRTNQKTSRDRTTSEKIRKMFPFLRAYPHPQPSPYPEYKAQQNAGWIYFSPHLVHHLNLLFRGFLSSVSLRWTCLQNYCRALAELCYFPREGCISASVVSPDSAALSPGGSLPLSLCQAVSAVL